MRALVVYESMYGNTRTIADAVAEGLSAHGLSVTVTEVGEAPSELDDDLDLLVVGGPTHALGMSRDSTRASAAEQGPVVSARIGLREWLDGLDRRPGRRLAAAFDTHIDKPVPGSAARGAAKRLRRLGLRMAAPAESFYVSDMEGPIVAGEVERAQEWGARIAQTSAVGAG
jgi:hypothetical protein